jgi:hypothetical protein
MKAILIRVWMHRQTLMRMSAPVPACHDKELVENRFERVTEQVNRSLIGADSAIAGRQVGRAGDFFISLLFLCCSMICLLLL